jgi:LysM repeat protein
LAVEYAKFTAQLNAAKEFRQATSDAVRGYANITTVGKTARTMIKNLGNIVQRTEVFRQQLSTLNQMGLNKDLYNQILQSGLDAGSATAKALLKGGPLAVEEMNNLFNQLDMTSSQLADDSTKVMFNGGEDVIQGFIDGVMAQDEAVRKEAESIAAAFNTQFQATLDAATLQIDTLLSTLEAKRGELETQARSLADSFNSAFQNALNTAISQNAPAGAPASTGYRADRGESISDVAAQFGISEEALLAANPKFTDPTHPQYQAGYQNGDYLYNNTLVNIPQAATGGMITGRGTGTSDSILARLSNGEFVMSASAVSKYGSGFMSGLNSGKVTMPSAKKSSAGSTNHYSITVQAGVGDPAQIGKQVVNAIAAYEKTSGKKIL